MRPQPVDDLVDRAAIGVQRDACEREVVGLDGRDGGAVGGIVRGGEELVGERSASRSTPRAIARS